MAVAVRGRPAYRAVMTFDPTGPPIIPGPAEPYTLASMMPAPVVKPPRPGWVVRLSLAWSCWCSSWAA